MCVGSQRLFPVVPETHGGERFAGRVRFEDEGAAPAGELIGSELDGRLFTDLSQVSASRVVTPNPEFYIRSATSRLLPDLARWGIRIDGMVERPSQVGIGALRRAARPMGVHLLECAGNVALTRFGLMSVADWAGVPVTDFLGEVKQKPGNAFVEISGFDEYSQPSRSSIPGASWIFSIEELRHAFLATEMNGQPLSLDHGAPVRLVIPGWYGCACIKWVNRITFVEEGVEASSQMREYAVRTLQEGRPLLAKDFQPARVEHAALPIRVEKWVRGGKLHYRVVGLAWGGSEPLTSLQIRFNPQTRYERVTGFRQTKTDPWTVWEYWWSPQAPGDYQIRLAAGDPRVRTRKLELGLYDRTVHISEV